MNQMMKTTTSHDIATLLNFPEIGQILSGNKVTDTDVKYKDGVFRYRITLPKGVRRSDIPNILRDFYNIGIFTLNSEDHIVENHDYQTRTTRNNVVVIGSMQITPVSLTNPVLKKMTALEDFNNEYDKMVMTAPETYFKAFPYRGFNGPTFRAKLFSFVSNMGENYGYCDDKTIYHRRASLVMPKIKITKAPEQAKMFYHTHPKRDEPSLSSADDYLIYFDMSHKPRNIRHFYTVMADRMDYFHIVPKPSKKKDYVKINEDKFIAELDNQIDEAASRLDQVMSSDSYGDDLQYCEKVTREVVKWLNNKYKKYFTITYKCHYRVKNNPDKPTGNDLHLDDEFIGKALKDLKTGTASWPEFREKDKPQENYAYWHSKYFTMNKDAKGVGYMGLLPGDTRRFNHFIYANYRGSEYTYEDILGILCISNDIKIRDAKIRDGKETTSRIEDILDYLEIHNEEIREDIMLYDSIVAVDAYGSMAEIVGEEHNFILPIADFSMQSVETMKLVRSGKKNLERAKYDIMVTLKEKMGKAVADALGKRNKQLVDTRTPVSINAYHPWNDPTDTRNTYPGDSIKSSTLGINPPRPIPEFGYHFTSKSNLESIMAAGLRQPFLFYPEADYEAWIRSGQIDGVFEGDNPDTTTAEFKKKLSHLVMLKVRFDESQFAPAPYETGDLHDEFYLTSDVSPDNISIVSKWKINPPVQRKKREFGMVLPKNVFDNQELLLEVLEPFKKPDKDLRNERTNQYNIVVPGDNSAVNFTFYDTGTVQIFVPAKGYPMPENPDEAVLVAVRTLIETINDMGLAKPIETDDIAFGTIEPIRNPNTGVIVALVGPIQPTKNKILDSLSKRMNASVVTTFTTKILKAYERRPNIVEVTDEIFTKMENGGEIVVATQTYDGYKRGFSRKDMQKGDFMMIDAEVSDLHFLINAKPSVISFFLHPTNSEATIEGYMSKYVSPQEAKRVSRSIEPSQDQVEHIIEYDIERPASAIEEIYNTIPKPNPMPKSIGSMMVSSNGEYYLRVKNNPSHNSCPAVTQNLELNTKNRNSAIKADYIKYGPLNLADEDYWVKAAEHWNTTPEVAKESNCGNCVAFDISPRMLDCMPGSVQDDGQLGMCWMHNFKCHSARTCYTWAAGGPITEDSVSYDWQERSAKSNPQKKISIRIDESTNPEKKMMAVFTKPNGRTKTIHFGARGMSDYTQHKDKSRRKNYLARHGGMGEDWNDPMTAGALSRWILWGKPSLRDSFNDFKKRFNMEGVMAVTNTKMNPRIPKKYEGQDPSEHSDLYTDEDPEGTIQGLGFKDKATATKSIRLIKNSGKTHAHKMQAAMAMEQRARFHPHATKGIKEAQKVYKQFIEEMKVKTKEMKVKLKVNPMAPGYQSYSWTTEDWRSIKVNNKGEIDYKEKCGAEGTQTPAGSPRLCLPAEVIRSLLRTESGKDVIRTQARKKARAKKGERVPWHPRIKKIWKRVKEQSPKDKKNPNPYYNAHLYASGSTDPFFPGDVPVAPPALLKNPPSKVIIVSGPSGSGKSTISKTIAKELGGTLVPTVTTRPRRPKEKEGEDRIFVSKDEFKEMIDNNEFVEYKQHKDGVFYGRRKTDMDDISIVEVSLKGMKEYKELYPDSFAVFLEPDKSPKEIEKRLLIRGGMSEANAKARASIIPKQVAAAKTMPYDLFIKSRTGKYSEVAKEIISQIPMANPHWRHGEAMDEEDDPFADQFN